MQLVIAEKPSVAGSIAQVTGAKAKKNGYFEGGGKKVTWCVGHLLELAMPEAYGEQYAKCKPWRREDLPIIPQKWKHEPVASSSGQLKIIKDLLAADDVTEVVCATDAGREGELIFRLVYEHCKCRKPVKRLWISSMEDSAIREGFNNLRDGADYDNLYAAALCRSQADWLVGINATRLFSALYGSTLNVGRVQSPTLTVLVERAEAVRNFVKTPFYTVELTCDTPRGILKLTGERVKDKTSANAIFAECDGKETLVTAVTKQEKTTSPPKLYDLTTLQREANRLFGYTAQQTLDCVQSLYEKKLATYPRTDSRYLTEDMAGGLPELVKRVSEASPFMAELRQTSDIPVPVNAKQVIDNSKVTDHHAIIPTLTFAETDISDLPSAEQNVMLLIAHKLVCAVGDRQIYSETSVTTGCFKTPSVEAN